MPSRLRTWILIADGAHARVFLAEAPGGSLRPVPGTAFANPEAHGRTLDLGTDRPGRTHESVGGARHALAPRVDWHREAKRDFARRIAAFLDQAALDARFDRLAVVAPPPMLGDLREALGPHVASRVAGELAKDLTKLSLAELAEHLAAADML